MILMNKNIKPGAQQIPKSKFQNPIFCESGFWNLEFGVWILRKSLILVSFVLFLLSGCKIYSFKNVSIPKEVKTIRVSYIENKATFVDPQLSPQLTDKLKQKINNQTSLTQVQDDGDYDVTGYISAYNISTASVSNSQAATSRLTVSVHLIFKNKLNEQKIGTPDFEEDVSRNFDFSASLSITDAEAQLTSTIVTNMTDEIFNRIFSNW
jgi:hypothetical protein